MTEREKERKKDKHVIQIASVSFKTKHKRISNKKQKLRCFLYRLYIMDIQYMDKLGGKLIYYSMKDNMKRLYETLTDSYAVID